ncbi:hypothetical protein DFH07DRAFT_761170 [Mycena maculata]|uniref:Uncharacterized protein n=1 Tax=Mycena maculata TaxID=230809 RepID=A0AAD7MIN1_9AGAR|nr:hypothetical protein DFH07DRAFT_761170 [Mycena maculata]
MAYYPNPTHAHGIPRGGQAYSIAPGPGPLRPPFSSPSRRSLPLDEYKPAQAFKAVTGRTQRLHAPIHFDYPGQQYQGVSMREIRLKGPMAPIRGADDAVFAPTGLQRIVFRIIWPGYRQVDWCRTIVVDGNITRAALAFQIASNFARFVEKSQYETPTATDWMISPTCVRFEHLFLVSLRNTFENVWQADVALDVC